MPGVSQVKIDNRAKQAILTTDPKNFDAEKFKKALEKANEKGRYKFKLMTTLGTSILSDAVAELGKPAPDFTLMDPSGKKHTLSEYKDQFVVLEWINFGCPFVKKHYDKGHMQKLQEEYRKKGVVWLAICSSAQGKQGHMNAKEILAVLKEKGCNHTAYLIDENGSVGKMYQAKTTPHMFIRDPKGILIYAGAIDSIRSVNSDDIPKATNYVRQVLDAAMKEKDLPDSLRSFKPMETKPYGCSVKYQK